MGYFHRPHREETDWELLFLCVSALGFAGVWLWLRLALPVPQCHFLEWTGLACPTCGATRCLRNFFQGDWMVAFSFNPLLFVVILFFLFANAYAAIVVLGRLPRLRPKPLSDTAHRRLRCGVIAIFLLNWLYVLIRL